MGGGANQVKETPLQQQQTANDKKLWNYQKETFQPYIKKFVTQRTEAAASPAEGRQAAGQVNAEIMKSSSRAGMTPALNPVEATKAAASEAGTAANSQTIAAGKVRGRQLGGVQNVIDIGRGQQTQAMQSQGELAGQSLQLAMSDKQAELQRQAALENAFGSAVGTVAGIGARKNPRMSSSTPSGVTQKISPLDLEKA